MLGVYYRVSLGLNKNGIVYWNMKLGIILLVVYVHSNSKEGNKYIIKKELISSNIQKTIEQNVQKYFKKHLMNIFKWKDDMMKKLIIHKIFLSKKNGISLSKKIYSCINDFFLFFKYIFIFLFFSENFIFIFKKKTQKLHLLMGICCTKPKVET